VRDDRFVTDKTGWSLAASLTVVFASFEEPVRVDDDGALEVSQKNQM
jgi:hypothetical protein